MKAHHQSEEKKCNIQHKVSIKGGMNLNTTKFMIFKGVHDQWDVEREHATAKSNTGLLLVKSTKRPFFSSSLVRRSCSPLPHNDRRYRLMTISGDRTGTTAVPALHFK